MRLGIVGTENSHAQHFVRLFNEQKRFGGHRITALAGGPSDRNRELANSGRVPHVVIGAGEMAKHVDAAIVCSRDGRRHREEAVALLDESLPVFVDKPLACTTADARAILDAAARAGTPVTSFSPLRWSLHDTAVKHWLAGDEVPTTVAIQGPADRSSPYGGLFFYGIHVVEMALALAAHGPVEAIRVSAQPGRVTVDARVGPTELLLEFVAAPDNAAPCWHVDVSSVDRHSSAELSLSEDYLRPGIAKFLHMFDSGEPPLTDSELLAPVAVLETIANAVARSEFGDGPS